MKPQPIPCKPCTFLNTDGDIVGKPEDPQPFADKPNGDDVKICKPVEGKPVVQISSDEEHLHTPEMHEHVRMYAHAEAWVKNIHLKNVKMVALLLSVVVYFILAIAMYMPIEDWGIGDCLYFAVVVVTTVGYGDYCPGSTSSKIATIFLAHFGLSIVVQALQLITDFMVMVAMTHAVGSSVLGVFEDEFRRRRHRKRMCLCILVWFALLAVGTIVYGHELNEAGDSDTPYIDGLYFIVITLTTVGFGDFSPALDWTKGLFCIIMLLGIPVMAAALGAINKTVFGEQNAPVCLQKINPSAFDKNKFANVLSFVEELRREEGVGNYRGQGDGKISRFEYFCFILVQNGKIQKGHIKRVMENFDRLDISNTGFIEEADAQMHESLRESDENAGVTRASEGGTYA